MYPIEEDYCRGVVSHISLHLDKLELPVLALMVKLWLPVVTIVEDFVAGGRLGSYSHIVGLGLLESRSASDNVDMRRDDAGE